MTRHSPWFTPKHEKLHSHKNLYKCSQQHYPQSQNRNQPMNGQVSVIPLCYGILFRRLAASRKRDEAGTEGLRFLFWQGVGAQC